MFKIKRIVILATVFVCILCVLKIFYFNTSFASKKGGSGKSSSWNFNSDNNANSIISLSDTITKNIGNIEAGCIGPGTEGAFKIVVSSKSLKTNVNYEIKLKLEENAPSNLKFFMYENNTKMQSNSLKELFENFDFSGSIGINQKEKTYEIFWIWPFETLNEDGSINSECDKLDLEFVNNRLDYYFEIEVTGKQKINL